MNKKEAAKRIGELATQMLKLAPVAGLRVGIKIYSNDTPPPRARERSE